MPETLTEQERLTLSRKARQLEAARAQGLVLEKPWCKRCGWIGDKPAMHAAACPQCGTRITDDAEAKKKAKKSELEDNA